MTLNIRPAVTFKKDRHVNRDEQYAPIINLYETPSNQSGHAFLMSQSANINRRKRLFPPHNIVIPKFKSKPSLWITMEAHQE